jgi:hypothetical protein
MANYTKPVAIRNGCNNKNLQILGEERLKQRDPNNCWDLFASQTPIYGSTLNRPGLRQDRF